MGDVLVLASCSCWTFATVAIAVLIAAVGMVVVFAVGVAAVVIAAVVIAAVGIVVVFDVGAALLFCDLQRL